MVVDRGTRKTYQQKIQIQTLKRKVNIKNCLSIWVQNRLRQSEILRSVCSASQVDSQAVLISTGSDPTYCEFCRFEIYWTAPVSVENGKWRNSRIHYIMDITHGLFLAGIRQTLLVFRGIKLLGDGILFFIVNYVTEIVIRISFRQCKC